MLMIDKYTEGINKIILNWIENKEKHLFFFDLYIFSPLQIQLLDIENPEIPKINSPIVHIRLLRTIKEFRFLLYWRQFNQSLTSSERCKFMNL
jgi:hypothetical protein